ncbi:hypothetical protein FSO04_06390 [Paraburkholderia madseniana]|uniref:Uncharacterized protein n=1 Tax=Paraburkholderia madseniana TaxID=2599607 RepID=A0A6N6WNA8_9BURK|nr:hypothetical protein [Paraburkholderia madseniana]KAE8760850.1 hypothetical protein FSO04_06390 [Paraburkholderia madseniana]
MKFISLDRVLCAIASHTELPDWVRLATPDGGRLVTPDDPDSLRNPCENAVRYSGAASLLHCCLDNTDDPLHPRWLDYRRGTGYPLRSDAAREDGITFLFEEAKWYWQWEEFDKNFHIRRIEVDAPSQVPSLNGGGLRMISSGGRWRNLGPTTADYARECPQQPVNNTRYSQLVEEIGFDFADIVAFLDSSGISHSLTSVEHPDSDRATDPNATRPAQPISAQTEGQLRDATISPVAPSVQENLVHKTARRGRRSEIEKAILHAQDLAGPDRYDVGAVYTQLAKLASDCPKDFYPLCGVENGQVVYLKEGRPTPHPFTRHALGEFLARRRSRAP